MVDIKVNLSGVELDNPIIPASGTFGFGKEFAELYDINELGAAAFKGTTLEPRFGNPLPRIAECTAGVLNAVGLQNPGLDAVINEELPELAKIFKKPLIANISGFSVSEYATCAEAMDRVDAVKIIEVNVSCPNVKKGGMSFGTSVDAVRSITKAVKQVTKKPIYMKLSPNVTDIVEIAKACEDAGADGLSMINTLLGMRIEVRSRKPVMANVMGGFSGPAILPIAIRMVYQVAQAVNIPIIGMGGLKSVDDVLEMIMAGATAVQIGAANLVDPFTCKEIIDELPDKMESYGIKSFDEIRGCIKPVKIDVE